MALIKKNYEELDRETIEKTKNNPVWLLPDRVVFRTIIIN